MTGKFVISGLKDRDHDAVIRLWARAGLTRPHNDPGADIRFAMAGPSSTILVGILVGHLGSGIAGSVMVGHDGHRGTIYYLAVDPDLQKSGLGAQLLDAAEAWLAEKGVWKLNLLIREENTGVREFYLKRGYIEEKRIAMSRRIDTG